MQQRYDHANLTIHLPEFHLSKTRKRRRKSDCLDVPRPDSSCRSDSSRTVTSQTYAPNTTPFPSPMYLSMPTSNRSSPPFDPGRTPTSSVFHFKVPSVTSAGFDYSQQIHRQPQHQPRPQPLESYHAHLAYPPHPLQQPNTPVLSPSDNVIFPPPSSSAGRRSQMSPGALGANLRHMGLDSPATPPDSPTPSPLMLSDSRVDACDDYFSMRPAPLEITPPDEEDIPHNGKAERSYFPQQARVVATCASTVARSVSMQRWLNE